MRVPRVTVPLCAGAIALIAGVNGPLAQMSEKDAFDKAVTSGSREDALAFIKEFSSSTLISELIELLPPETAVAVCAGLASGASRAASRECSEVTIGTAPAAGTGVPDVVRPEQTPSKKDLFSHSEGPKADTTTDVGLQRDTAGNGGATGSGGSSGASDTSGSSSGVGNEN